MGQLFSRKQPEQTPEDINQLRAARTDYQDTLTAVQTNVQTDIQTNELTPESGQLILKEVQKAFTWLEKNPNATIIEVYANQDATSSEIKRLLAVDKPKKEFKNQLLGIPVIAEEAFSKDLITRAQVIRLKEITSEETDWLAKSGQTATAVDFQQENLKLKTKLQQILEKAELVSFFTEKLNAIKTQTTSNLESDLLTREQKAKAARNSQIHIEDGISTIQNTALKTFFGFLLITICILGGSLAANAAIGRAPAYRILYFLYGAIPFFTPIIILYTIFKRLYVGPLPYYAILPLTIEPATSRLGRLLLFPFYWIPDDTSREMARAFISSVEKVA